MNPTWRKTKDGTFVVFAREEDCAEHVDVVTKSGKTDRVKIERWSRPFDTEHGRMCYGTPVSTKNEAKDTPAPQPTSRDEDDYGTF